MPPGMDSHNVPINLSSIKMKKLSNKIDLDMDRMRSQTNKQYDQLSQKINQFKIQALQI